jgi:cobalt-zinc-cadmium efflux system outer membrane protein
MHAWFASTPRPVRSAAALAVVCLVGGCAAGGGSRVRHDLTDRYRALDDTLTAARATPADSLWAGDSTLDRRALVEAVLARNPELESARQGWRAALAAAGGAGSLADPTVSYGIAPRSLGKDMVPFGQTVEIRQMVPFPGKLGNAGDEAAANAEATFGDYRSMRVEMAAAASKLYDDWYVVHRALAITDEHVELVDDFRRVATSRYAAGLTGQEDPIKAEVEGAQLERRLLELERTRRVTAARLNALLHRDPDAPIPPPPGRLAPPAEGPPATADGADSTLARRPDLQAARARVRGMEASVDLAGKESLPDLGFMTSYNSMTVHPEHRWMVGVMLNLPLEFGKKSADRERARADLARARSAEDALSDAALRETVEARAALEEAARTVDVYRGRILPASRDQLAAARSGYEAGSTPFLNVIEAERALRTAELEAEEALADYHRAGADLDRATGRLAALEGGIR